MEKHSHLFERFANFGNMYDGYRMARRQKRYLSVVLDYSANLEENLIDSVNRLQWKMYEPGAPMPFFEYFPKKRLIHAMPFYDRVINCAAYNVLFPIYRRSMYEHSYGSIPGMGTLRAVQQLQEWMRCVSRKPQKWYLGKLDIAKFFFRVPIDVQLRELGRPLDDPDMMWFLKTCIKGDGRPTGLPLEFSDVADAERIFGIGMPVGSLISQMTANVVMNPVDHYMKRVVQIPILARYMDDMYLQGESKMQVWDALGSLDDYLQEHMGLQLNQKTAVMPYDSGVEFVGRIITPDRIDLRKSTTLQIKKHLNYVQEAYGRGEVPLEYALSVITSYMGLLKHTSSEALKKRLRKDFVLIHHST